MGTIDWTTTVSILGVAGIIAGAVIKIFKPNKDEDLKNIDDQLVAINKKVNANYTNSQLHNKDVDTNLKAINEEIITINEDRKKDIEKFETKIEKIHDLIIKLIQEK